MSAICIKWSYRSFLLMLVPLSHAKDQLCAVRPLWILVNGVSTKLGRNAAILSSSLPSAPGSSKETLTFGQSGQLGGLFCSAGPWETTKKACLSPYDARESKIRISESGPNQAKSHSAGVATGAPPPYWRLCEMNESDPNWWIVHQLASCLACYNCFFQLLQSCSSLMKHDLFEVRPKWKLILHSMSKMYNCRNESGQAYAPDIKLFLYVNISASIQPIT